jgi:hypothetical protein
MLAMVLPTKPDGRVKAEFSGGADAVVPPLEPVLEPEFEFVPVVP